MKLKQVYVGDKYLHVLVIVLREIIEIMTMTTRSRVAKVYP